MLLKLAAVAALTGSLSVGAPTGQLNTGPYCQPMVIVMDSGNGPQYPGKVCGQIRRHPDGTTYLYVDGTSTFSTTQPFLAFTHHVR